MKKLLKFSIEKIVQSKMLRKPVRKMCRKLLSLAGETEERTLFRPYHKDNNVPSFTQVVAVSGCGHSGSGTVIDFLSEFSNCTVLGYHDLNGGTEMAAVLNSVDSQFEIDILRDVDGLFELEKVIERNNFRIKNAAVHRFIDLCERYYYKNGGIYNDYFIEITEAFLDEIIDYSLSAHGNENESMQGSLIVGTGRKGTLFHLKRMGIAEYRACANRYMKKLLGIVNSKDILVLDQFVTDRERDFSKKLDYIDNLKVILVYRDPRDVFATSHVLGTACHWIPKDVENFISWYTQSTLEQLAVSDNHLLSVRFEDFVNEYDNVSGKIMVFLNLDRKDHASPKSVFNPELSAKNIGLYKSIDRVGDMKKIEKVLGDYCYDAKGSSV